MRKGKKAGPRRIDPETFFPAVWVAEHDGTAFLVCQKRLIRQGSVTGGPKEAIASARRFVHGAAIRLGDDLEILLGLGINTGTWRPTNPADHEISKRAAQVALAEAWHGVKIDFDLTTMEAHLSADGPAWKVHKKGVRVRNVIAAIRWDQWNADGVPLDERAEILALYGHPCTAAQLAKFAEDRGF
jgi:hypothetical protein